jgi:hypothetical protein
LFCEGSSGQWGLACGIDDNYIAGLSVLRFSEFIGSSVPSGIDSSEMFCVLVAGGKDVGVNGRAAGGGVAKAWKCQMQQQHHQQQQKQPAANQSVQRFVKGALRFKKKVQSDVQVSVDRDPLACFFMQDIPVHLRVTTPSLSNEPPLPTAGAHTSSPPSLPSEHLISTTQSIILHVSTLRSFRSINLSPLPSHQKTRRIYSLSKLNPDTREETFCDGDTNGEAPPVQTSQYFDHVQAPLVSVLPADGCAVTLDEIGSVVVRDLTSGKVAAVMQRRESADERVMCLCHVPKNVREELAAGNCSEKFPAFFVGYEGGAVGVYTQILEFLYTLNRVSTLPPPCVAEISITCMACMLSKENSVLLLGLGDGRIVLYDLDGGDAAAAVTSALSVYRSLPLIIEEASSDVALGLSCSGSSIVLARGRLCLKLLDVRRNRNVIASMRVTHNKSIVAAVYQQAQRTGLILLLQVMRCDKNSFHCDV